METSNKSELNTPNQQEVWENIADEWNSFKETVDPRVMQFVMAETGRLLDLGCGSGRCFTKTFAEIYALDFSKKMLKHAEKNAKNLKIKCQTVQADLTKTLPFQEDFFDSAIAVASLHCIEGEKNRQNAIKELYRVLKPKAKLLIKVWNKQNIKFAKKPNKDKLVKWRDKGQRYYYFYDADEIEKELKSAGFKILQLDHKNKEGFEFQEIFVIAEK